ncbi:MAG: hypothetical protein ACOY94_12520 [Bacillota bacterium]
MRTASLHEGTPERKGLPGWILFAAIPLVLALGFISGIALSVYRPAAPQPTQTSGAGQTDSALPVQPDAATHPDPANSPAPGANTPPVAVGPRESPDGRRTGVSSHLPRPVDDSMPSPSLVPGPVTPQAGPTGSNTQPSTAYGQREVRTLVEARAALSAEFGAFRVGGEKLFSVDYQRARDIDYNVVLIGIIKISEYDEWLRATTEHPNLLNVWLKAAAERIRPAALNDKFTLTWTIYETVSSPPYGFASKEVTPDPRGGGYVVTRPLAAVTDVAKATVAIASTNAASSQPATGSTPWSTYGPVIRFDPTDLYRPVRNTTTKP